MGKKIPVIHSWPAYHYFLKGSTMPNKTPILTLKGWKINSRLMMLTIALTIVVAILRYFQDDIGLSEPIKITLVGLYITGICLLVFPQIRIWSKIDVLHDDNPYGDNSIRHLKGWCLHPTVSNGAIGATFITVLLLFLHEQLGFSDTVRYVIFAIFIISISLLILPKIMIWQKKDFSE